MAEQTEHITINGKYRIVIERAASTSKGILGYKVEANNDDIEQVAIEAQILKDRAEIIATEAPIE